MNSSVNKLVDKYQYNEASIKKCGQADIITAKHIILKEYFTLKKISTTDSNCISKYHSILNQMSILKILSGNHNFVKCHKMLKTSNHLYVVYDLQGGQLSLKDFFLKNPQLCFSQKKKIAFQLLLLIKQMKSKNITHLSLSLDIIQISKQNKLKILNMEHAINLQKSLKFEILKNLKEQRQVAPEVLLFKEKYIHNGEGDIRSQLLSQKFWAADIYSLGKIFEFIFCQSKEGKSSQNQNYDREEQEEHVEQLITKMIVCNPIQRPSLEQILEAFSSKLQKSSSKTNTISKKKIIKKYSGQEEPYSSLRKSNNQLLLSPKQDQRISTVSKSSVKSTGNSSSKRKPKKSAQEADLKSVFKTLALKIFRRRNLCQFLLKLALTINSLEIIDPILKVFLSYLLTKKSTILICSLARLLSTGKSQSEQIFIKEPWRKEFSKINDCFKISVCVGKEMDFARKMLRTFTQQIAEHFFSFQQIEGFDCQAELRSDKVDDLQIKNIISKVNKQILNQISAKHVGMTRMNRRKQRGSFEFVDDDNDDDEEDLQEQEDSSFLNSPFTPTSNRDSQRNFLAVSHSRRKAKSAKCCHSTSSANSADVVEFQNELIAKVIDQDRLAMVYLMSIVFEFGSYEKMFEHLITEQNVSLENQNLFIDAKATQSKVLVLRIQQMTL